MLIVLKMITGLDTDFVTVTTTVTLIALTGTAIGLAISTLSKSSEQAVTILPILVIAQAVHSGGLARMTGLNQTVAMLFSSSFWGLEAFKTMLSSSLINATFPGAPGHYQPSILGRPFPLEADLAAIVVQTVILLAVSLYVLAGRRT